MATVSELRREYLLAGLSETDLDADPMRQFARWFDEAVSAQVEEPNAMTLATASAKGVPSARVVLLKGYDKRGFVFFTNYESRKGRDLAENPVASLVFLWKELERQVCVQGLVQQVSRAETEAYFRSRPEGSQLGAWASKQSEVIGGREVLVRQLDEAKARFQGGDVPPPPWWGGYRVVPHVIEFWQGRPSRLHDRLRYLIAEDGGVRVERLSP